MIGPLNVSADYVDKISKGNIPAKITDNYNGDFNTIKNNLNTCIDAVGALVADANMLVQAAVEGKLSTRADAQTRGRLPQDRGGRECHAGRRGRAATDVGQRSTNWREEILPRRSPTSTPETSDAKEGGKRTGHPGALRHPADRANAAALVERRKNSTRSANR